MSLKRRWLTGMKIKREAEELYLEPDVAGWPANTPAMIVERLKEAHGQAAANIDADLIHKWAHEENDGELYTWYELRVISRSVPAITSAQGGMGLTWKELILLKIEMQDVRDQQVVDMIKAKAELRIGRRDEAFQPADLMEAVTLSRSVPSFPRRKQLR